MKLTKAQKEVLSQFTEGKNTLKQLMERTGKKWGPLVSVIRGLERKGAIKQPNIYQNEYFLA